MALEEFILVAQNAFFLNKIKRLLLNKAQKG